MKVIKMSVEEAEQDWKKLLDKAITKNAFVDWPWIRTIHMHPDVHKIQICIVYDDNDEPIIGVPIYIPKYKGDYSDILISKGIDSEIVYPLITEILKKFIKTAFPYGSHFKYNSAFVIMNRDKVVEDKLKGSWNIILPKSIEEYELSLNKKVRYNINYREKLARKDHKFEICSKVDKDHLWMFYMLNKKRWGPRWFRGQLRNFLDCYIDALGDKIWVDVLMLDDIPVFTTLGMVCGDIFHSFLSGYDDTYKKYGPGKLLYYHKIRQTIKLGFSEYDFMKGDSIHKQSLGAQKRLRFILERSMYV